MFTRYSHSVLLVSLLALVISGPPHVQAQVPARPVVIGEKLQIQSKVLDEFRTLFIAKPAGYEEGSERYPVLYLLDGESHFAHVAGISSFLAGTGRTPEMLLVGVANTNRSRDLTPPTQADIDLRFNSVNGGADAFLRFISDELIPFVDRNYRTRPYRILAGHSFGGLFALHALANNPKLFSAYIAISPTVGWNDQATLRQIEAMLKKTKELNADLYITSADEPASGFEKLCSVLKENSPQGFRWSYHPMPEQTHISVPHESIYQGLDTIFSGWHLGNLLAVYDQGGLEAIHRHFREGGKRYGYERTTSAFTVSLIVAALLNAGRLDEAAKVLLHDPKAYSPPWNQLDALAAAYAGRQDNAHAIQYYKLSLETNPANENARKNLRMLGVDGLPDTPRK